MRVSQQGQEVRQIQQSKGILCGFLGGLKGEIGLSRIVSVLKMIFFDVLGRDSLLLKSFI